MAPPLRLLSCGSRGLPGYDSAHCSRCGQNVSCWACVSHKHSEALASHDGCWRVPVIGLTTDVTARTRRGRVTSLPLVTEVTIQRKAPRAVTNTCVLATLRRSKASRVSESRQCSVLSDHVDDTTNGCWYPDRYRASINTNQQPQATTNTRLSHGVSGLSRTSKVRATIATG